jgi:hypothetical protein
MFFKVSTGVYFLRLNKGMFAKKRERKEKVE